MTNFQVTDEDTASSAAAELASQGAKQILITLGDKGALYRNSSFTSSIDAIPVVAVDEAGAGDAFRAIFLHTLLHEKDIGKALTLGNTAGAYAVTHFGSYNSMPDENRLHNFLINQPGTKT